MQVDIKSQELKKLVIGISTALNCLSRPSLSLGLGCNITVAVTFNGLVAVAACQHYIGAVVPMRWQVSSVTAAWGGERVGQQDCRPVLGRVRSTQ